MSHLRGLFVCIVVLACGLAGQVAPAAHAEDFAAAAFQQRWAATDAAVRNGQVSRSYFWGPEPFAHTAEPYITSPAALRHVQYFDKARMEINDPTLDPASAYYVSNGLLTVELVSGRMQMGDSTFQARQSAQIPVAGDTTGNDAAPTYASFRAVATIQQNNGAPDQTGKGPITDAIDRNGFVGTLTPPPARITYASYQSATRHNIASVFWTFMHAPPLQGEGWLSVFGYPISEPFWAKNGVTVAGKPSQVLIQLFERRVLTYEPSAPPAYQVQMGNIGQHYFRWRYGTQEPVQGKDRLLLAEAVSDQGFNLVLTDADGSNRQNLTDAGPVMTGASAFVTDTTGRYFIYTGRNSAGIVSLYSVGPDGSPPAAFALDPAASVAAFALNPLGQRALADAVVGNAHSIIELPRPGTSGNSATLFRTANRIDQLSYSPDGAFVLIKEILPDGSIAKWIALPGQDDSAVRLPNFGSSFGIPAWSPVAPLFAVDTNLGIRTYNVFTHGLQTVSPPPRVGFTLARPFFSADGTQIIYAEVPNLDTDAAARIYVINVLTGEVTTISDYNSTETLAYGFTSDPGRVWVTFRPFGVTTVISVEADTTGTGQQTISAIFGLTSDDHIDSVALRGDPVRVAALIAGDVRLAHRDGSDPAGFAAPDARRIFFVPDPR